MTHGLVKLRSDQPLVQHLTAEQVSSVKPTSKSLLRTSGNGYDHIDEQSLQQKCFSPVLLVYFFVAMMIK